MAALSREEFKAGLKTLQEDMKTQTDPEEASEIFAERLTELIDSFIEGRTVKNTQGGSVGTIS